MKLFRIQLIFLALALIGVIGLGVEIFIYRLDNLTMIYIFAGLGLVGLVGNAVAAVLRIADILKK